MTTKFINQHLNELKIHKLFDKRRDKKLKEC